jgi:hypothetical protein
MSSFVRALANVDRRPTVTLRPTMASPSEAPWDIIHAVTPAGWYVGPPSYHAEHDEWTMYAFDPGERPDRGARSREWTVVGATEEGVVREMAWCLKANAEGRAPR